MNKAPALYIDFQAWINFHNDNGQKSGRKIRVAMPDGRKAYVAGLTSTEKETVISIVVETVEVTKTTKWVGCQD